ncbi:MAG: hypothetical protein II222_07160, partial [Paraprevotella sp.]|nr:hypothetical protein [Paraprevotella sp.]
GYINPNHIAKIPSCSIELFVAMHILYINPQALTQSIKMRLTEINQKPHNPYVIKNCAVSYVSFGLIV